RARCGWGAEAGVRGPRDDGRPLARAPRLSPAMGSDHARPLESGREPRPARPPWPRPSSRGRKSARRRPGSDVRPDAETGWRATRRDAWRWLGGRSAGQCRAGPPPADRAPRDDRASPAASGPAAACYRRRRARARGPRPVGALCEFGSYSSRCERLCRDVSLPSGGAHSCPRALVGLRTRRPPWPAARSRGAAPPMLDLGTTFLTSVARAPQALAIVDGDVRLTYSAWYERISALVAGLDALGLEPGDHLVTVLQNRWQAATIHWACQFAGMIVTPLNWRCSAEELNFCVDDAEAKAIVYEEVSAAAVHSSNQAQT